MRGDVFKGGREGDRARARARGKTDYLGERWGIRISFLVGARDTPLEISSELGKIRLYDRSLTLASR